MDCSQSVKYVFILFELFIAQTGHGYHMMYGGRDRDRERERTGGIVIIERVRGSDFSVLGRFW